MKALDRFLQTWRINIAAKHVTKADKILDVGTHDGALFRTVGSEFSVGVDPNLVEPVPDLNDNIKLIRGLFPGVVDDSDFDAIVILAVIEHLDAATQKQLAANCFQYLKPGGKVIVTTPSPAVDTILDILFFFKIIDGMGGTHDDHYGFDPADTVPVFEGAGFSTKHTSRFQLGLNNLFVFEKAS